MNDHAPLRRTTELLTGKFGVSLAFAWGFAEGTLFFLVPDIIITFAALFSPKRSWAHPVAVLAGSLVGGAVMFGFGAHAPQKSVDVVNAVPFVTDAMVAEVSAGYARDGATAMLKGPTSGVPYKLFAVLAPQHHVAFATFLVMSVPARLERLVITWVLFGGIGLAFGKFWIRRSQIGVAIHALYWVAIYAIYWTRIG